MGTATGTLFRCAPANITACEKVRFSLVPLFVVSVPKKHHNFYPKSTEFVISHSLEPKVQPDTKNGDDVQNDNPTELELNHAFINTGMSMACFPYAMSIDATCSLNAI